MFHRESGVFKTTYAADMALYPLPIAKWTVIVLAVLFVGIVPLTVHDYYLSILNLIFIAIVGALGLNILVGYTGQISLGHGAVAAEVIAAGGGDERCHVLSIREQGIRARGDQKAHGRRVAGSCGCQEWRGACQHAASRPAGPVPGWIAFRDCVGVCTVAE